MDKCFIKDMSTGRHLTHAQFNTEVDKISFAPDLKYVVIDCHDPIDAVIKMQAAIKNQIVFTMIPINATSHEREVLLARLEKTYVPRVNGYQIATTSGSTAQSKIILSTREEREKVSTRIIQQAKITSDDIICILRLSGNGAWVNAITTSVISGATVLLTNERKIPTILKYLNENKPSVIFSTPALMANVMNNDSSDTFGSNIRCWYVSGSHLNKNDGYKMEERLQGGKILHGCSRAEGNLPLVCSIDDTRERRIETNGKEIIPDSIRIVDGELQIHSDHIIPVLDGKHEITDDGWYLTGDLVARDPDGYIKIIGRKKLLFDYGPITINPLEVEEIIDDIQEVIKSYCVNYKPCYSPETDILCICIMHEERPSPESIKEFLCSKIPIYYEVRVVYVNEFPMTHSGKIDRKSLTASLTDNMLY